MRFETRVNAVQSGRVAVGETKRYGKAKKTVFVLCYAERTDAGGAIMVPLAEIPERDPTLVYRVPTRADVFTR